jgi:hypothetical protein
VAVLLLIRAGIALRGRLGRLQAEPAEAVQN